MQHTHETAGLAEVVTVSGDLDAGALGQLDERLRALDLPITARSLILSCGEVATCDSGLVELLGRWLTLLQQHAGVLCVAQPAACVEQLFQEAEGAMLPVRGLIVEPNPHAARRRFGDGLHLLEHYRLEDSLPSEGQAGPVFAGRSYRENRLVAIKRLFPYPMLSPDGLDDLRAVCENWKTIDHPGFVPLLDSHFEDDEVYLVWDWLPHPTLLDLLRARQSLPLPEVAPLLARLAEACDAAIRLGLANLGTRLFEVRLKPPESVPVDEALKTVIREPRSDWDAWQVKLKPWRISSVLQGSLSQTIATAGSTGAGIFRQFLSLVYTSLGGYQVNRTADLETLPAIASLGSEANDFLTQGAVPAGSIEGGACREVVDQLCRLEGVSLPAATVYDPDETKPGETPTEILLGASPHPPDESGMETVVPGPEETEAMQAELAEFRRASETRREIHARAREEVSQRLEAVASEEKGLLIDQKAEEIKIVEERRELERARDELERAKEEQRQKPTEPRHARKKRVPPSCMGTIASSATRMTSPQNWGGGRWESPTGRSIPIWMPKWPSR